MKDVMEYFKNSKNKIGEALYFLKFQAKKDRFEQDEELGRMEDEGGIDPAERIRREEADNRAARRD